MPNPVKLLPSEQTKLKTLKTEFFLRQFVETCGRIYCLPWISAYRIIQFVINLVLWPFISRSKKQAKLEPQILIIEKVKVPQKFSVCKLILR
jgi:hypothetical protein